MSQSSANPDEITNEVYDIFLQFLVPLFLNIAKGNEQAAQRAARMMLDTHGARTNRQLRLATLVTAFTMSALDTMDRAANPSLSTAQVSRLRANANALNRSAAQNERQLDKLVKPASKKAPDPVPTDMTLPASTVPEDLIAFARAVASTNRETKTSATVPPRLSRQQRRAAEREAEKRRKREEAALLHASRQAARLEAIMQASQ